MKDKKRELEISFDVCMMRRGKRKKKSKTPALESDS
jgi:hypothetical protein